ncbi:alpha/beta fold hydrolase [Edaphobacter aggregans]|uniref:alpha/beta fold hydrolase n=1 Tax=Edaphobacter aggregans TaxID=570835 RepID=UPI003CCB8E24
MEAFCRNYHVVAVDLRGHGQSDKPQLEYTLELFAGDIATICGELHRASCPCVFRLRCTCNAARPWL